MPIEFAVQIEDFSKALKCFRVGRARGKKAHLECVDINARGNEIEPVSTGASVSLPADVLQRGYGRVPYGLFESIGKVLKSFRQPVVRILILPGQLKVASLTFSHPEISMRLIGPRIADLPIDAPLVDVLGLQFRFTADELEDSGLVSRMLAAQEQTSALMKPLRPSNRWRSRERL
jgi:hypothetical protein